MSTLGWSGPRVHVTISARDGPPGRYFARPGASALHSGARRALGRGAGGRSRAHRGVPPALSPDRPHRPSGRAASRALLPTSSERRRWLEPVRGRPLRPVGDDQDLLRDEDGGRGPRRPRPAGGPRAHSRHGRPRQGQRVRQDPARAVRRVRLERRADHAGRDHAAAAAVLPVQYLRGLLLVALRDRAAARHHGPKADQVAAPPPVARRAVADPARADEPALPAGARAVLLAGPVLEELLHRRRRRPEDLGALLAAPAAQARDRGGPAMAGGAPRGTGWAGWHLSG